MSTKEEDKQHLEEEDNDQDEGGAGKGLSKAQKKKLKAKAKKDEAPVVEAKPADEEDEGTAAGGKAKKGKKGAAAAGGRSAIANLAKERMRIKAEEEERIRKEEEAIRLQEEEEERIRQEELRKIKEEEDIKKREKQEWKNKLKAEGKWVTKAQKAKQEEAKRLRQQLIESGVIRADEGAEEETDGAEKKPKSQIVRKRKDKKKDQPAAQQQENGEEAATEESKQEEAAHTAKTTDKKAESKQEAVADAQPAEEEDVVEDWENADIDDMASKIASKSVTATVGGKALRIDEEEEEDIDTSKANQLKQGKETAKIKQAVKQNKEEEKFAGGDVFAKAMEGSSTALARQQKLAELKAKQEARKQEVLKSQQMKKQAGFKLRCPILCILGHVDTGKTLILDKLRRTNVQAGEAGGITQQIGATYFPESAIVEHMQRMKGRLDFDLQIPGFQIIDTPGHESFTNLRSRGSSLCDFAILVVDIMHGLEKQTLESLQLLKNKKTPFVVALNKIDRIYQWKSKPFNNVRDSLDAQESSAKHEFRDRLNKAILAFAEEGINAALYWENDDPQSYVSLVPTSAITGEGLPDLVAFITYLCQTNFKHKLKEKEDFECSVLEVKVIEGHGTTIDVILVNGTLNVGDTIVLAGFNGPVVTTIRALLTPQPMREMRVKGEYIHHESIKGSMGIKISAPGLENAMAGSELYRADNDEEIETFKAQIADDLVDIMDKYVDKTHHGVCVQASTIGSLEALLEFLKTMKIPVTSINIGPVHRKDILKAMKSLQGDHIQKEFATILAFDVKIMPDAQQYADDNGITIFTANIIYHLFDQFEEYVKKCRDERKSDEGSKAVFPCILEMVKGAVFHVKDPVVIGVTVKAGILKIGTPLCIPDKGNQRIGRVESIELNGKPLQMAKPSHGGVAMKLMGDSSITYGRHFDDTNQIASLITRDSIDALKQYFKDDLNQDDWKLVVQLKKMYGIP